MISSFQMKNKEKYRRMNRPCKIVCVLYCVFVTSLYIIIFYEDTNSIRNIDIELYNSEKPYVTYFTNVTFSSQNEKRVAIWTTFFRSHSWLNQINAVFSGCVHKCRAVDASGVASSDAILFHYQRNDLNVQRLPKRNPDQIWIIYLLEPTTYIERNIEQLNGLFNWTMSYRKDSSVLAPYGSFVKRKVKPTFKPPLKRRHFAFAVFSRCNDNGKRYRIVKELQKYIDVDIYGSCGHKKCDTKAQGCLSTEKAQNYLFRLSFENTHCKDYVTEKLWFSLKQGVIPVVNWAKEQLETRVNSSHVINLYDFATLKDLANYLKSLAVNETLYKSYFSWRDYLDVETSHFHSFCSLCEKLHHHTMQRQVYSDLNGWVSNDICPRYRVGKIVP